MARAVTVLRFIRRTTPLDNDAIQADLAAHLRQ
jgi:hypothetical protein